jgi:glycosyltransferase involved in cell wall biosynthesis
MKLAVFHNLPSGGAKRALHGLVKYLAGAGCHLDVVVPSTAEEGYLSLHEFADRVDVVPVRTTAGGCLASMLRGLPPVRPLGVSISDLEAAQRRIARIIDGRTYDVALVEQDRYTMSPFLLRFLETPHVYYCQQPCRLGETSIKQAQTVEDGRPSLPRWLGRLAHRYGAARLLRIDRQNAAAAHTFLVNSYFSSEAVLRTYGRSARVSYLGVDDQLFVPRDEPRSDYVLSVGYLGPHKGYDFLIRALGLITPRWRPRLLVVANSERPGWRQHLEGLAGRSEVAVEIRTSVEDKALIDLYNRARLLVYAPYLEPFGLVPLEAMACGTPVVAVREGGVRESVRDGETGVLVERDEQAFAAAVAELLADDHRRAQVGRRAVEAVRAFWTVREAGARLLRHLERRAHGTS